MASIKNNPLLSLFIISLLVFNVLFFTREFLILSFFRIFDVYSQCPEETLSCAPGTYTYADDVILGLFAISIFATLISASILLSNLIGKLWHKRPRPRPSSRQRQQPRPRRPRL